MKNFSKILCLALLAFCQKSVAQTADTTQPKRTFGLLKKPVQRSKALVPKKEMPPDTTAPTHQTTVELFEVVDFDTAEVKPAPTFGLLKKPVKRSRSYTRRQPQVVETDDWILLEKNANEPERTFGLLDKPMVRSKTQRLTKIRLPYQDAWLKPMDKKLTAHGKISFANRDSVVLFHSKTQTTEVFRVPEIQYIELRRQYGRGMAAAKGALLGSVGGFLVGGVRGGLKCKTGDCTTEHFSYGTFGGFAIGALLGWHLGSNSLIINIDGDPDRYRNRFFRRIKFQ